MKKTATESRTTVPRLSSEQISQLKKQHGEPLIEVSIPGRRADEPTVIAYFRKPTRRELAASLSQLERDPFGANEMLMRSCIVSAHSDMAIIEDDALFMAAMPHMQALIEQRDSSVKKL
jgi:hypothetical protein